MGLFKCKKCEVLDDALHIMKRHVDANKVAFKQALYQIEHLNNVIRKMEDQILLNDTTLKKN